jgi:hypothetical protein
VDAPNRQFDAVLMGRGSELAAAVFPEIDELILKLNPVLTLSGSKAYGNGFMMLHYRKHL